MLCVVHERSKARKKASGALRHHVLDGRCGDCALDDLESQSAGQGWNDPYVSTNMPSSNGEDCRWGVRRPFSAGREAGGQGRVRAGARVGEEPGDGQDARTADDSGGLRGDDAGAAEAAYDFDQALGERPVTRLNVFER